MPEISVITPVYNTEKYLLKCLNSIKNQTFKDFEVILIDDGSKDASPAILDEFAKTDARFKVFHKKNEGVTKARKDGIEYATGTYIAWVDSDDWIEENHLEQLYNAITANNADICVCNFVKEDKTGCTKYEEIISNLSNPLSNLIEQCSCRGCLWTKLIKKSLFDNSNVFPPDGINCWEDVIISANLYNLSKSTVHIPIYTYHVNDLNESSITRNKKNAEINMTDKINVIKYFENNERFKNLDLSYLKYNAKFFILLDCFMTQKKIPEDFYNLFGEKNNYKILITVLKDEQVSFGPRFIELFLILANIQFLAKPLHYLLANLRQK